MAEDFAQLTKKLAKVSAIAVGAEGTRALLNAAGRGGRNDYRKQIGLSIGAERRLSNWWPATDSKGRKGPTLGAAFKATSDTEGYIKPAPLGPFSVADVGRKGGRPIKRGKRKGQPSSASKGHYISAKAIVTIRHNTSRRINTAWAKQIAKAMR